jgi:hypothetical protein
MEWQGRRIHPAACDAERKSGVAIIEERREASEARGFSHDLESAVMGRIPGIATIAVRDDTKLSTIVRFVGDG